MRAPDDRCHAAARAAHLAILHPRHGRGHATVMSPAFDGSTALRGRELATSPKAADAGFVSLQRFNGARKGDDVAAVNAFAWADVEIRPGSPFHGVEPEDVAGILLQRLDDAGVPRPSYVTFSGRGLWLVWIATRALPSRIQGRVRRALRCLWGEEVTTGRGAGAPAVVAKAAALRAIWDGMDLDRSVADMARVHRVAGSINPKSGEVVRLVWPDSWVDVQRGDFEDFAAAVLPFSRQETEAYLAERDAARAARHARAEAEGRTTEPKKIRIAYGLHGIVATELVKLATHLGPERIRELGLRDLIAFHVACARARAGLGGDAASWAADLAPLVGLSERTLRTYLKPVAERLRRHEAGETVEYRGRQVSRLYWHRIDRIVSDLGITADLAEASGLVRLVPDADARPALTAAERQAQRRRRQGAATREERAAKARALSGRCMDLVFAGEDRTSDAEVARQLGVSRVTVARAMDRFEFGGDDWADQFEAVAEVEAAAIEEVAEAKAVTQPSRSLSVGFASEPAPTHPHPTQVPPAPVRSPSKTRKPVPDFLRDPVARLQALIQHHTRVLHALHGEDRKAGIRNAFSCHSDRERQAVAEAQVSLAWEMETGRRCFPVSSVPDRVSPCDVPGPRLH